MGSQRPCRSSKILRQLQEWSVGIRSQVCRPQLTERNRVQEPRKRLVGSCVREEVAEGKKRLICVSGKRWPFQSTHSNQVGTTTAAKPRDKLAVAMKRARLDHRTYARMRTPATATLPKRKVVMPPGTEAGIACRRPVRMPSNEIGVRGAHHEDCTKLADNAHEE